MINISIEKKGQCHNYAIFLASKYFESINDFINLEKGIKRFTGNMTKFFYNPIVLTKENRNYFPNLRTQLELRQITKCCGQIAKFGQVTKIDLACF